MIKNTFIYALCCPLTGEVRYIGKANKPKQRFSKHKCLAGKNHRKNNWIEGLIKNNLSPTIKIIEEVPIEKWKEKEKHYILKYKESGCDLLNISGGGNGSYFGNSGSFSYERNTKVKVVCLSLSGEYINTFDSVKKGQEFCGHKLFNALNNNTKTTGGYIWLYKSKYDELSKEELQIFVENCNYSLKGKTGGSINTQFGKKDAWNKGLKGIKLKPNKNIHQYTSDMKFIKTWNTAKEAAINLFGDENREEFLARCARGQSKTSFGYYWTYNKI